MFPTNPFHQGPAVLPGPYNDRWDQLRLIIERLYIHEDKSLQEVMQIMKTQHAFDATKHAYKYYINRKWKLKKNIPISKKKAMLDIHHSRAALGKSTNILFQGREVDPQKLRRLVKDERRKQVIPRESMAAVGQGIEKASIICSALTTNLIVTWNMPYGAMRYSGDKPIDHLSPFAIASTPSDIAYNTPRENSDLTPRDCPSPLSIALRQKQRMDRAFMFLDGRHSELLKSMDTQDRRIMSAWLYQFWLFSFTTAKRWGYGHRDWTATLLGFERFTDSATTPVPVLGQSPMQIVHSDASSPRIQILPANAGPAPERPLNLCRWSIHAKIMAYQPTSALQDGLNGMKRNDDPIGTMWPKEWREPNIQHRLRNGLEANNFSDIPSEELPIALGQVLQHRERSPEDLLREAISFAVIGRNVELVDELCYEAENLEMDLSDLHLLHLAATYLDGSKTCCNLIDLLIQSSWTPKGTSPVNDLGHTVLDTLLIVILKSHTTCSPKIVEDAWKAEIRFPGEEVDVCGRWDADSDCIRALFASGEPKVPRDWKHKFCHTSAQAICHSICSLAHKRPRAFDSTSGLFLQHCGSCGMKLQLRPLHAVILVAFLLAHNGCEDEDLFGIMAVVLCLLQAGMNPLDHADISLSIFLREEQSDECTHDRLAPMELATRLRVRFGREWSERVDIGWQILLNILGRSQEQWRLAGRPSSIEDGAFDTQDSNSDENTEDRLDDRFVHFVKGYDDFKNYFHQDQALGTMWAAAQTEMLTYRRVREGDSWNSPNFDMLALLNSLQTGSELCIGLVEKELMNPFCDCGTLPDFGDHEVKCPTMEGVSAYYFANLEDWSRITMIVMPSRA